MFASSLTAASIFRVHTISNDIKEFEAQVHELFRMLKEARGMDVVIDDSMTGMNRRDLITSLSRQIERKRTIGILEGKGSSGATTSLKGPQKSILEDLDDDDAPVLRVNTW